MGSNTKESAAEKLAADAIEVASAELRHGGPLTPFVIVELAGMREVMRFGGIETARERAMSLGSRPVDDQHVAFVRQGRVGHGEDAIVVDLPEGEQTDVFYQRFRPERGRFRRFKLIGDMTSAGQRESFA